VVKLASLAVLVALWALAAAFATQRLLPGPWPVFVAFLDEVRHHDLLLHFGMTLWRVAASFTIAMALGVVGGYVMGRSKFADKAGDPLLILLLNLPALVVIILAYVWIGLGEAAAIVAVALNKLPNVVVTLREGARTLDPALDEMAQVFRFSPVARQRHVVAPQLYPYLAAAARGGLSIVWKIVLVVELLGRPNGVGFQLNTYFQLFDVAHILAYALSFVAVMLVLENFLVQPLEHIANRWRPRPA
jgi:NitT/TauT family transport system permease protein